MKVGRRVSRGGSWYDIPVNLRVSNRNGEDADDREYGYGLGFRLVQEIP